MSDLAPPSQNAKANSAQVFTVSQLNQRARQLLEISFSGVRVEGELSSLSRPSSGHWYFTLKDDRAQVRCAMFKSSVARLKFLPKEGDRVELRARVSLYEARGDYQLIVDGMKPGGEGALLLAFQQLKEKLRQQGLFEDQHKQPLPVVKRVGIVTSSTGAALHDILTVLKRRSPNIEVDIYPTLVQGKEATGSIVAAIERANRDAGVDVLIVGRGGGSLEDLWCFNEEAVARAIFTSRIPVVSAVGHEVDVTIADFVADLRAPTPSAAAELISRDQLNQQQVLVTLNDRLVKAIGQNLQKQRLIFNHLQQRVRGPVNALQGYSQRLDMLEQRLLRSWKQQQQARYFKLNQQLQALKHQEPGRQLKLVSERRDRLNKRMKAAMERQLKKESEKLATQAHLLNSLSPLKVLSRGYSLTQSADGEVIQDSKQVSPGDRIQTRLNQGWLDCKVVQPHEDDLLT